MPENKFENVVDSLVQIDQNEHTEAESFTNPRRFEMTKNEISHPMQPFEMVGKVLRFKENPIVSYLLEKGGLDMNHLACQDFTEEDRQHFAQLIGYSLSGWGTLSYVNDQKWQEAQENLEDFKRVRE